MNITEITSAVKSVRGKASRRIVRERLLKLEELGIIVNVGADRRPRYMLKNCLKSLA